MVLFIAIKPIPKLEWIEMVVFQGSFLTRLILKGYPCRASRLSDKFELMTFLGVDVDVRTSFRQSGDGFKFLSATTEADNRRDFIDDKPPEMDVGNTI